MPEEQIITDDDKEFLNEEISDGKGSIKKEHFLTVGKQPAPLAVPHRVGDVGIEGMDLPASMISLPYVKLVQKSSSKTILTNGKDAEPGKYYFTDSKSAVDALEFVILRSKVAEREFVQDDRMVKVTQLMSLCITSDMSSLFILILPVTSFTSWGKLIASMKGRGIKSAWEYEVIARSEKRQNTKGQYYVADIQLGKKISKEDQEIMSAKYAEYGGVLERRDVVEQAENQEDL